MQSVDINGSDSEPCVRFTVQFKGAVGLAAQHVSKALGSLKRADGSWRDLHAKAPADGNRLVRVYVGRDQNAKQTPTERRCKKLLLALKKSAPRHQRARSQAGGDYHHRLAASNQSHPHTRQKLQHRVELRCRHQAQHHSRRSCQLLSKLIVVIFINAMVHLALQGPL